VNDEAGEGTKACCGSGEKIQFTFTTLYLRWCAVTVEPLALRMVQILDQPAIASKSRIGRTASGAVLDSIIGL